MTVATVLAICALAGSIYLLTNQEASRLLSVLATVAAGIEVALALRWITLQVAGYSLALVLGGILAVAGVLLYLKVRTKLSVTAATLVAFIGLMQVLIALKIFRGGIM